MVGRHAPRPGGDPVAAEYLQWREQQSYIDLAEISSSQRKIADDPGVERPLGRADIDALLADPAVLVLDEATSLIDPRAARAVCLRAHARCRQRPCLEAVDMLLGAKKPLILAGRGAWTPDGMLLMADKDVLYGWRRGSAGFTPTGCRSIRSKYSYAWRSSPSRKSGCAMPIRALARSGGSQPESTKSWNVAGETSAPSRRRDVTAARPASVAQVSSEPRSSWPSTER